MEKLGLKKGKEKMAEKKPAQEMENYLQTSLDQYRLNCYLLKKNSESFMGLGHKKDTQSIGEIGNTLKILKEAIIRTAQELGKDGNYLIAEIDEEVQRSQENKRSLL